MSELDQEEEDVLKKYVKDLREDGEMWTGTIESEVMIEAMERELLTLGVSFVTQCSRHHGQENSKEDSRPRFSREYGALPLRLDMPFRLITKIQKGCILGKDQHKREEKRAAAMSQDCNQELGDSTSKKKRRLQGTKKRGCTAIMYIKVIEVFPDFKVEAVEGVSEHKIRRLKTAQLAKLSDALSSGQELRTERMIFFKMSRRSFHTEHGFSEVIRRRQTAKDMEEKCHMMGKELQRVLKLAAGSANYAKMLDAVMSGLKKVNTRTEAYAFMLKLKASCKAAVNHNKVTEVQLTSQTNCRSLSLPMHSGYVLDGQPAIVAESDNTNHECSSSSNNIEEILVSAELSEISEIIEIVCINQV